MGLGKSYGLEPEFWFNLQMRYTMRIAGSKIEEKIDSGIAVGFSKDEPYGIVIV